VTPGFIKENICVKILERKFLFLTVCSHLQVTVFQGSQIYLGDLALRVTSGFGFCFFFPPSRYFLSSSFSISLMLSYILQDLALGYISTSS